MIIMIFNMKLIPLNKGFFAKVDDADFEKACSRKWFVKKYAHSDTFCAVANGPNRTRIYLHRLLLDAPKHLQVDHADRDGLNNQRSNIRLATRSQNQYNRRRPRNNTSGYKGVTWKKDKGKFEAKIFAKKKIFLGYFDCPKKAHAKYCEAAISLHGEFARIS